MAEIDIHLTGDGVHCVRFGDRLLTPHEACQVAFDIIQHATTAAYANGRDTTNGVAPHHPVCKVCCQECAPDEIGADGACRHCWNVYGEKWLR